MKVSGLYFVNKHIHFWDTTEDKEFALEYEKIN